MAECPLHPSRYNGSVPRRGSCVCVEPGGIAGEMFQTDEGVGHDFRRGRAVVGNGGEEAEHVGQGLLAASSKARRLAVSSGGSGLVGPYRFAYRLRATGASEDALHGPPIERAQPRKEPGYAQRLLMFQDANPELPWLGSAATLGA